LSCAERLVAKRPSRVSLNRVRFVAHVHCACEFFSSTAAAVEEGLNAVTGTSR
jgi:hypothetical protein